MDSSLHFVPLRMTKITNPVILRESFQRNGTDDRRVYSLDKDKHLAARSSVNAEEVKLVFAMMNHESKIKNPRWIRTARCREK